MPVVLAMLPPLPLFLSLVALAVIQILLGAPCFLERVPLDRRTPLRVAAVLTFLYVLAAAAYRTLDPYALAVVAASTWAALAALAAARDAEPLGGADVAVFLLLWIPFDLRWTAALFPGPPDAAYVWWALHLTIVGAIGFGRLRAAPGFDYRLVPRARDFGVSLGTLLAFGALAIPIGLAVGFLRYPPTHAPTLARAASLLPELFLTVALPEELYFRGVLQAGLERRLGRPRLALAIASLAFGLMHWNNAQGAATRLAYFGLASLAGLFYGTAYRRAGIFAAALCHTLVDLAWTLFLE